MKVTVNGEQTEVREGASVLEAMKAAGANRALAAMEYHTVVPLTAPVRPHAVLSSITTLDEEGRRIYERTMRFIMLMAVRDLMPGQRVRVEYSAGYGVYVRLPGAEVTDELLDRITTVMREIAAADLPIIREEWSTERARGWYADDGQLDKVELLSRRSRQVMTMYGCTWHGRITWDYFYGSMAPSTGYAKVFSLHQEGDGFVIYPALPGTDEPAPVCDRPKHLAVFNQSAAWCRILGVENVADLARMAENKQLRSFIRVNEALHDQAIAAIAKDIVTKNRHIVMVAGPSSSGKTTFAGRLAVHLQVLGRKATRISLDDYYLNRVDVPLEPDGTVDLEAITTLDLPLLQQQMTALLQGETVEVPRYSFHTGSREAQGVPFRLGEGEIAIVEGIHGLNPMLSEGIPADEIYRVFVSALTCLNLDDHNRIRTTDVRLLRRIVRDYQFRGTRPEATLAMWPSVRRGEEKWIFPYQEMADSMFNTALHYELPVLAHYAAPLISAIPKGIEGYNLASRLRKILNYMPPVQDNILREIPPLSLLREFIGGCTIEEE